MPQEPRGEHGGPCRGRMWGIHAQWRGRHTGSAKVRRLRLPPQLPPERRRRRADADAVTQFLLWHQQ
ncbi:zinc-finger homeodomain protein 5 [Phtheirospermum japonicum]|uniref:Zinc-finger homeodomain protein 5 n=1 Tax=Phtheirospermum japonicum TaxID=374723 RepID=A0A830BRQ5_9LAMI|nr:zinc-finger homeodomain protein 5 [Phtheirospermum japonicum]